ncbi:hypothetical protein JW905_05200 [bacterium]|nr:hypothetical protein [candidate division CSSED10-310 bacterium]
MRRQVPLIITAVFGLFFVVGNFISAPLWKGLAEKINIWALIIISFAYVLGVINIGRLHVRRVRGRREGWGYSLVTVAAMLVMVGAGIFLPRAWGGGYEDGSLFLWLFDNVYVPMQSSMFALLAFFIASAAFRAFRVRNVLASLLAVTAVVVMMGRVSVGELIWSDLPRLVEWIMSDLQNAGKRGIMIGASLGAIATGLKIILGIERTYLSGE